MWKKACEIRHEWSNEYGRTAFCVHCGKLLTRTPEDLAKVDPQWFLAFPDQYHDLVTEYHASRRITTCTKNHSWSNPYNKKTYCTACGKQWIRSAVELQEAFDRWYNLPITDTPQVVIPPPKPRAKKKKPTEPEKPKHPPRPDRPYLEQANRPRLHASSAKRFKAQWDTRDNWWDN